MTVKQWMVAGVAALWAAGAAAFPTIQHWQTANGVPVYLVERHGLPVIDLRLDVDAGESRSPLDEPGVASMTAYGLMDKEYDGNELRSPLEILTDTGNQYWADIRRDRATINLRVVSTRSPMTMVSTVAKQLADAKYPFESFKYRRDAVIGQLTDDPAKASAEDALTMALYGKHPLGNLDRRTPATVKKVGNSDTRGFQRRYYVPGNLIITLVGDVSRADAEKMAELLTAHLPKGEAAAPLPALAIPPGPADTAPIRLVRQKNQSTIEMAQLLDIDRQSPDMPAIMLGNYMLGSSGFQSRLMRELREKRGLTYNVNSSLGILRGHSMLDIEISTRSEQEQQALQLLRDEVARFTREGPSDAELSEAKDRYLRSMSFWGSTNESLIGLVANLGYYGLPLDYYDRLSERIAALTAADIKTAWQRHVDPARFLVAIEGPEPAKTEAPAAAQASAP
ncbi:peptidase M16 [Chitiniphilus shinanonensis]|uniref:Peptidase M16 n=1 Tax=Chitiniphilus shinanonensis TaxID=553088 RepID=A0ABQ6BLV2_9NEIS|nr:pitrilysin family protein [Chitiniphilus shinanonensis]GLS02886.1 peptidase M16 [Chitiniphilus shinanonensis]